MRIDLDYISTLLNIFLDEKDAHITIFDLMKGDDLEEKFVFHIQLLCEKKLISDINFQNSNLKDIGILSSNGLIPTKKLIRLTSEGHDFAYSLANKDIFNILKTEFKDPSLGRLLEVSLDLSKRFVNKQFAKYF